MSSDAIAPIIIIKRKKIIQAGHHGGAWKVAYADFVTAMMAFFMLMWLLNATTEDQRKGVADYFSPTIPLSRMSGGGTGMFGGDSIFTEETLAHSGQGPAPETDADAEDGAGEAADEAAVSAEVAVLLQLGGMLNGQGAESDMTDEALRHVVTRLTDEGLVIEVFSLPGAPIFEPNDVVPMPVTVELIAMIARIAGYVTNDVAVESYVASRSVVIADNPIWEVTAQRAAVVRQQLEAGGLDPARIERLTGHGDRDPTVDEVAALRNDRFEIVLLRSQE